MYTINNNLIAGCISLVYIYLCNIVQLSVRFSSCTLFDDMSIIWQVSTNCVLPNVDIVEAHCYFVDIGRIDREQIRSRINNNDCRTFRPRRPLSTAYRTKETAV